jgi:hypothetical protein
MRCFPEASTASGTRRPDTSAPLSRLSFSRPCASTHAEVCSARACAEEEGPSFVLGFTIAPEILPHVLFLAHDSDRDRNYYLYTTKRIA